MLKRIYVNNFRCLVNFELNFDHLNLILGYNGSGKSTLFDVIRKLQQFIINDFKVEEVFKYSDLTRWQKSDIQSFELEFILDNKVYKYCLDVRYETSIHPLINRESLNVDNENLFEVETIKDKEDNSFYNEFRVISVFHEKKLSQKISSSKSVFSFSRMIGHSSLFIQGLSNIFIAHINPFDMNSESRTEDNLPLKDLSNFSAWYSHLSQSEQGKIIKLTLELQKVLTGFDSFQNKRIGEARLLSALFTSPSKTSYKFNELSEGQKVLIALYTLLYCTPDENCTLMIDEPENFLALPEIQPWLSKLIDRCTEDNVQAILISHHPSLINSLATNYGYWFERKDNQPVRVQKIVDEGEEGGLSIAKLIEMKWIYDQ
ncbi:MAG: ATP-binding protein [Cyanobacteria bacterium P01_A01_bin.83]